LPGRFLNPFEVDPGLVESGGRLLDFSISARRPSSALLSAKARTIDDSAIT
jgi:hypothetical protein